MTRLEELLHSLTTIIILYHDSQPKTKKIADCNKEKAQTYASTILEKSDEIFNKVMDGYIKACTTDTGYGDRSPLLHYLLNEINFLRFIKTAEPSLNDSEFILQKEQLLQLISNLKELLGKAKGVVFNTRYSKYGSEPETSKEVTLSLSGLKGNWNSLCNSGLLIKEHVFDRFALNIDESKARLQMFTDELCMEYRNKKLCDYLKKQNELFKAENQLLKEKDRVQASLIENLKMQIEQARSNAEQQNRELSDSKKANEVLKNRIHDSDNGIKLPANFSNYAIFGGLGLGARHQPRISKGSTANTGSSESSGSSPPSEAPKL